MGAVLALLVLSAFVGLLLGLYFAFTAIMLAEPVLAVLSAAVLHHAGFDILPGFATLIACLAVSQFAYLAGIKVRSRGPLE